MLCKQPRLLLQPIAVIANSHRRSSDRGASPARPPWRLRPSSPGLGGGPPRCVGLHRGQTMSRAAVVSRIATGRLDNPVVKRC